jgi:hypothetical protein
LKNEFSVSLNRIETKFSHSINEFKVQHETFITKSINQAKTESTSSFNIDILGLKNALNDVKSELNQGESRSDINVTI